MRVMRLTIPVGMSDVVILLGSRRQAERVTRRILAEADNRRVTEHAPRRGFGERKGKGKGGGD